MLSQSPSQIYKANLRGHEEDATYRCLSTLNFGIYYEETRKPFGGVEVLNDETLAAQQSKNFIVEKDTLLLLLPLVGTLTYQDNLAHENFIDTEEILLVTLAKGTSFTLQNRYENELINYLQIRLQPAPTSKPFFQERFDFSIRNELFPIASNEAFKISIGIFDSRNEGVYQLEKSNKGVLAFAINGAFEFQNRLLETRDGLALWDIAEIEFEALTENAIMLLLETSLQL